MKLSTRKVQNSKIGSVLVTAACIGLILILVFILYVLNNKKISTVGIVQVKENLYVNTLITEDKIQEYQMSQVEFDGSSNTYLKWEDREECIDKYASVATKVNGYIYAGDYVDTKPTKNEYFLTMAEDDLVVTLPYNYSTFGNLITLGDSLRINATYTPDTDTPTTQTTYGLSTEMQTITIFEKLEIIDMLNSAGNSVYDYYMDLLNMTLAEREEMLKDSEFISNVTPQCIVLTVKNNDEFNKYCLLRNLEGITWDYGLYPRKDIEDGDILGQFEDLTRQISSARLAAEAERVQGK